MGEFTPTVCNWYTCLYGELRRDKELWLSVNDFLLEHFKESPSTYEAGRLIHLTIERYIQYHQLLHGYLNG